MALTQEDRENLLMEILTFARIEGRTPAEVQALTFGGVILSGFDLLSETIGDLQTAIETSHTEAIADIAGTLAEHLPSQSETISESLADVAEAIREHLPEEK